MLSKVLLTLTMCVSVYAVKPETLSEADKIAFIAGHNLLRSKLDLTDLVWDSKLASAAEEYGSKCVFEYSPFKYGENLYSSNPKKTDNTEIVIQALTSWASEQTNVDPEWDCIVAEKTCKNYYQMVSKSPTKLGCAITHCNKPLENFVVCMYDPPA